MESETLTVGTFIMCPICNREYFVCGTEECNKCTVGEQCSEPGAGCHCDDSDVFKEFVSKQEAMRVERNIALREQNRLLRLVKRFIKADTWGKITKIKNEVKDEYK